MLYDVICTILSISKIDLTQGKKTTHTYTVCVSHRQKTTNCKENLNGAQYKIKCYIVV